MVAQLFVLCVVIFTTGADFQKTYDLGTTDDISMQFDDAGEKQSHTTEEGRHDNEAEERLTVEETASRHLSDDKERPDGALVVVGLDAEQFKAERNNKKQQNNPSLAGRDIDRDDEPQLAEETSEQLKKGDGQQLGVVMAGQSETEQLAPTATFNCKFFVIELCLKD